MYQNGKGVAQNYDEAFKWYKLAADQGHLESPYYLGIMYYKGEGVSLDKRKALDWFKKACGNGHNKGCEYYEEMQKEKL